MRKVLLATTALVALGGVSAASADIAVTASSSFNYVTTSGGADAKEDRDVNTQVDVAITGSAVLDNGMTVTGMLGFDEASSGQSADGDDAGMTISGDFGTLAFGGIASATLGAMATDVTADEGFDLTATDYLNDATDKKGPADEYVPNMDVSYALPTVSGVSVMLGMTDGSGDTSGGTADDGSGFGITYNMGGAIPVTVNYTSYSTGAADSDVSSIGAKLTAGGATITVAANEDGNYEATGIGATYAVSDALTLQAFSSEAETGVANVETELTGFGLTYTVTPGMKVSITQNDFSGTGGGAEEDGSRTAFAVDVSF
jgi:hypothetical protein